MILGSEVFAFDFADVTEDKVVLTVCADVIHVDLLFQSLVCHIILFNVEFLYAVCVDLARLDSLLTLFMECSLAMVFAEDSATGSLTEIAQFSEELVEFLVGWFAFACWEVQ